MKNVSRLLFLRTRYAALAAGSAFSAQSAPVFHPTPAARFTETCGGVVFRRPAVAVEISEPVPADYVPPADEPIPASLLTAEEIAAIDAESAIESAAILARIDAETAAEIASERAQAAASLAAKLSAPVAVDPVLSARAPIAPEILANRLAESAEPSLVNPPVETAPESADENEELLAAAMAVWRR